MWEIAENLHRQDLTVKERDEHIARWVELTELAVSGGDDQLDSRGQRKSPQQTPSGINAAARELNIPKSTTHKAVKVASLPEPIKEAIREAGLDDNQTAMLAVAKNPVIETVQAEAARRQQPQSREPAAAPASSAAHSSAGSTKESSTRRFLKATFRNLRNPTKAAVRRELLANIADEHPEWGRDRLIQASGLTSWTVQKFLKGRLQVSSHETKPAEVEGGRPRNEEVADHMENTGVSRATAHRDLAKARPWGRAPTLHRQGDRPS